MNKTLLYSFAVLLFLAVLIDGLNEANSYSGNPPEVLISVAKDGNTPTCNSCHGTGETGSIPTTGGITITKKDGNLYANNLEYDITLSVDRERNRHGFQFIALDDQGKSVGTLSEDDVNLNIEDDALDNVDHISHHNIPSMNGGTFQFKWTAPDSYQGAITFHMMAVAANGNAQNTGDSVFYETMSLTYDAAVGVDDLESNIVHLYPNPATDHVFVDNATSNWESVELFNMNGRVVLSSALLSGLNEVQTGDLNRGMYFVQLSNEEGAIATRRLILR